MKWVLSLCMLIGLGLIAGWQSVSDVRRDPGYDGGTVHRPTLLAVDSSGFGNHAVIQGRPALGRPGIRGTAYSFDRPGSWLQVAPTPMLNPGRRDFLLVAWVRISVAPGRGETYDVLRKGLSWTPGGDFKVEVVEGGRVRCSAADSTGRVGRAVGPATSVADAAWHRIGCARTGARLSVVVDSVMTTKRVSLGSIDNALPLSIGSKYGNQDVPLGHIDEVALFIADDEGRGGVLGTRRRMRELMRFPVGIWHLDETP